MRDKRRWKIISPKGVVRARMWSLTAEDAAFKFTARLVDHFNKEILDIFGQGHKMSYLTALEEHGWKVEEMEGEDES